MIVKWKAFVKAPCFKSDSDLIKQASKMDLNSIKSLVKVDGKQNQEVTISNDN